MPPSSSLAFGGNTASPNTPHVLSAPDYDKSQWINEKEKLGLDFPNVGGLELRGGGGWLWGWVPWWPHGLSSPPAPLLH